MVDLANFLLPHRRVHPVSVEHTEQTERAVLEQRVSGYLAHVRGDHRVAAVPDSQSIDQISANLPQRTCDQNPVTGRLGHALR